jgi:hypothetical protein
MAHKRTNKLSKFKILNMEQKVKIKVEQVDNGSVFKWYSGDLGETEFLVAKKEEEIQTLGKMIWEDINNIMDQELTSQIELDINYKTTKPNETQN